MDGDGALHHCEVIMKQHHPKSQTTQILFQEPTAEEMQSKSGSVFSNICAILLIASSVFALVCMLRSCANEAETQAVQAHAYNAKFSEKEHVEGVK